MPARIGRLAQGIVRRLARTIPMPAKTHQVPSLDSDVRGAVLVQAATITDYNGSTKELTVAGFTSAPAAGDIAVIV